MKAAVQRMYGPPEVLHLEEVQKPVPGENDLLIKVRATTATSGDWHMRKGDPFAVRLFNGPTRPRRPILGSALSGEVEPTALFFLWEKGRDCPGRKELIYGASGAVGTSAVQLARHFGAEVTGVCSTANLELIRSLGARHTIDYTREDFTAGGLEYDVIFDTVGTVSFARRRGSLGKNGVYLAASDDNQG